MQAPNVKTEIEPLLPGESLAIAKSINLLFGAIGDSPRADAWLLQLDGATATLYVLAAGRLHELRSVITPKPMDEINKPDAEWNCDYRSRPITANATYSLKTTRVGVADKIAESFTFRLDDSEQPLSLEVNPDDSRHSSVANFVLALIAAIVNAPQASYRPPEGGRSPLGTSDAFQCP
jgi:hypothetical protein